MTALHDIVANAPDLASGSKDKYRRDLDAWIAYAGQNPKHWTRKTAQAFYNQLLQRMKPQSANRLMSSVAYASKWWAHQEGSPDLDFAHVAKASEQGKEIRHALDPSSAIALLNTTRGNTLLDVRDRCLIIVGLETGMRRMSLGGMLWERQTQQPYHRTEVPIKGHGSDLFSVPLSDTAMLALMRWREQLDGIKAKQRGPVFRRLLVDRRSRKYGYSATDDGISGQTIHKIISTRALVANVGHVHPHLFRHSFVTWRTEMGATNAQIAAVTGHSLASSEGALGGYKDLMALGETARGLTPLWLIEWFRANG